jgi:hypothetical protein
VPQIAVFWIFTSTSLMPISGTGTCSNQSPGSGFAFINASILEAMLTST